MVWAMEKPSSFGDYFPDGDYVGWREGLAEHFNRMPEAERVKYDNRPPEYIFRISAKFKYEIGVPFGLSAPLTPIEPHEWPTELRTEKSYKTLGSLIQMTNRFLAVDTPMKELIERFEPGVHLFHPLRITMPRGRDYPAPYHMLVIGRYLDAFVPEKSDEGSWEDASSGPFVFYRRTTNSKKCIEGLAISASATAGAHLWSDRKLRTPEIFLSDELRDAAMEAGLRLPKHYKVKDA
ncbi:hypothetical protein R5H32_02805 [Defluviimonas sp. D31]|uniref:imm11 family protein n=1 Tax=Defluviimonas sp. D31 TaxID=3083253 RepID=UPI00296F1258|nr:DUF1629 domain-containing protein [Defluviimonas sp. D31]MDW4548276.1 hypothetical protein [Defluviimonas sp. D31]